MALYEAPVGPCWLWSGSTNGSYGIIQEFQPRRQNKLAHRVSYELSRGPIPPGLSVCHSCDTPLCINPQHLWLGTQKDNIQDMIVKGRRVQPNARGTKNPRVKLLEKDVRLIRRSPLSPKILAERFQITRSTICAIRSRRIWKHLQ